MIYFDTAYLAKCYLNERGSDEVRQLAANAGRVACSCFGKVELAATIHRNLREGKITAAESKLIWKQMEMDEEASLWTWLEVSHELIIKAMRHFRSLEPAVFIRSADAFHLVSAVEYGFKEIYSNDRHLLKAASSFKIKGCNILL